MSSRRDFHRLCQRTLASTFPCFGLRRARKAVQQLAERRSEPGSVVLLIRARVHRDALTRGIADQALRNLEAPKAVDALCDFALAEPESLVAALCQEETYRPSDPEMAAVYLIATGQVDAHFAEHQGLNDLRAGFARADPSVQALVNATALKGDARLLPFITKRRRTFRECTPEELDEGLGHSITRKDWKLLFADCQELPLLHSLPGWEALVDSGWQPEDEGDAAMLRQIENALKGKAQTPEELPPRWTPPGTSAVFETWLAAGREETLTQLDATELVDRIGKATPPEAVPLVAALALGGTATDATRQRIAGSEHWMVRMAGYLTGLLTEKDAKPSEDSNYWVREIAGKGMAWSLWPEDATIDRMQKAGGPREAALMPRGGPRAILRAVLEQRMKGGAFVVRERPRDSGAAAFKPVEKEVTRTAAADEDFA